MPLMEPQTDRRIDPARYLQRRPQATITRLNGQETAVAARLLGLGPSVLMLLCPEPLPLDARVDIEIEANVCPGASAPPIPCQITGSVFKHGLSEPEHAGQAVTYVRSAAALCNMLLVVDEQSPGRPILCSIVPPLLMQLMRCGGMSYYLTDEKDRTIFLTETETALTGYAEEEILGINRRFLWRDPRHPDAFKQSAIANAAQATAPDPLPIYKCDFKKRSPRDREMLWLGAASFAILDTDNSFVGIQGVYYDITHWTEESQRLLSASRDHMTIIAHQIKSPLAAIAWHCQLVLESKAVPQTLVGDVKTIHALSRIAMRLQKNLEYLSLLLSTDRARVTVREDMLDLEQELVLLADDFRGQASFREIRINVDTKTIAGTRVRADRTLLLVFSNLIDNALKYSFRHTEIVIRAVQTRRHCRIQIENVGIPIRGAEKEAIREKGYRADVAKAMHPGTGLGLWLCDEIIKLHPGMDLYINPTTSGDRTIIEILIPHERIVTPRMSVRGAR